MAFTAEYVYRLLDKYSGPLSKITRATERFRATAAGASKQAGQMGRSMQGIGARMTASVTLPILGMGVAAAKTAVDFQSAFIGVQKTVDASASQLAVMREEFKRLSTEIPVSATELMNIGMAAGQLGIQTENITSFTKTIAMLGKTTNLAGEEGATQLARFANITQMSQQDFDRLGATIVHLGNNLATTEAEIVSMGMRLAGAGSVVKMSEAQIMAMAGTLTSLGINAEAGGTAFSRVMLKINDAVAKGGPLLTGFARTAGMSSKDFADTFKKDASKGILSFVEGLARMQKEGKNVNQVLAALEMQDIRVRDALLRAAGSGDLFRKAMAMGNQAWKENTALTKEANLRFQSWSSQLTIAWNKLKLIANEIGKIIVPMFISLVDTVMPLLRAFGRLPNIVKKVIVVLAGLIAIIGPLLVMLGMVAIAVSAISIPMIIIAAKIALVVAAIGAWIAILVVAYRRSAAFRQSLANLYDAFSPLINLAKIAAIWVGEKLAAAFGMSGQGIESWADIVAVAINVVAATVKTFFALIGAQVGFITNLFQGDLVSAFDSIFGLFDVFFEKFEFLQNMKTGFFGFLEDIGLGPAKDKAAARQDNKMEISGQIGVTASGGAQVKRAEINLNTGYNLAVAH